MSAGLKTMVASPVWTRFRHIPYYLAKPVRLVQSYDRSNLRPDIIAGITVAVILLPQAIAFALIAELPPQMGLYAAVVGAVIGALWGSCEQLHTGPANAISLMVLSVLLEVAAPGTQEFFIAASFIAVMVGLLQLFMGLARLGLLVNFVSHSVIIGFAGGAGVLIAINQVKHLLRLELSSDNIMQTLQELAVNLPHLHPATATLGIGTMLLIAILKWINPRLPATLVSMIAASGAVYLLHLNEPGPDGAPGVAVIGQLPASLPPLAPLMQTLNLDFIADLSVGALAVGAIGLVQTTAIAQSIAAQTGQRLSSNQEFVGQGLANIAAGVFSGYPVAASFSRSAVSIGAGAKTGLSAIFSSMFVLLALFTLAPLAVYLPRAALAGVLIMTAFRMVDRTEIVRIWRGAPNDAVIMIVTFLATLFLTIEFAVLAGILLSFVVYVMKTSVPKVVAVLPDSQYRHLVPRPDKPPCPQLGIIDVFGDLYFGATSHFERAINRHIAAHPDQRFLLLRMRSVNQCDFSGIHALESILKTYRERGGDIFLVRVAAPILELMKTTDFHRHLGPDHFLKEDEAVTYIFHKILDPAVCIYECEVRAFKECQNLPKKHYPVEIPPYAEAPQNGIPLLTPQTLWENLHGNNPPFVIDVREPREYRRGHIPQARLMPLPTLVKKRLNLVSGRQVVCVCRSGRRSMRAAHLLQQNGSKRVVVLQGGMLAWETAGFLEAVENQVERPLRNAKQEA